MGVSKDKGGAKKLPIIILIAVATGATGDW